MRYKKKTKVETLREKYKFIVGWGAGGEFRKSNVGKNFLDFIVDSGEKGKKRLGNYINDLKVCAMDEVSYLAESADSVLIVIFPNIEQEILNSIHIIFPDNVDTIVARLLDFGNETRTYSTNCEDTIILEAVKKMQIKNFSYMDVGVCHPIIRNNTYLFYEMGNTNGVLVEPNKSMCNLADEYRPMNKIINCGASSSNVVSELEYYYDINNPGLNTFLKEISDERSMTSNSIMIPVYNINKLIRDNFESCPDVLDIDTEGMDFEIIKGINYEEFPIRIICAETNGDIKFYNLLSKHGYHVFAETKENTIFIKE